MWIGLIEAIEKSLAAAEKKTELSATPVAPLAEPASVRPPESKDLHEAFGSATAAERSGPDYISPNLTPYYRKALIAIGIALVMGCLVWALTLRRPPKVGSTAPPTALVQSVVPPSDSETISPSLSPSSKEASAAATRSSPTQVELEVKSISERMVKENFDRYDLTDLESNLEAVRTEQQKAISAGDLFRFVQAGADGGAANDQFLLGAMYEFGVESLGVKVDYAKATDWYRKAAGQGLSVAKEALEDLARPDPVDLSYVMRSQARTDTVLRFLRGFRHEMLKRAANNLKQ